MERVIAYIDGFNLYFGLRSLRFRHYYWLDIPRLVARLLEPGRRLVATKYFTSRITQPPEKVQRQNEYLEALSTRQGLQMFYGVYQVGLRRCRHCAETWEVHSEKMTDVNIAVELLTDAHRGLFDTAVIMSADADLSPALIALRSLYPGKRVVVMFPPGRGSVRLQELAHERKRVREWVLRECQLPDEVPGPDGYPKRRPVEWTLPGVEERDSHDPPDSAHQEPPE